MSEFEEKVLEMLKKIDEKLDKVLESKSKEPAPAPKPTIAPAAASPSHSASGRVSIESTPTVKPSSVVEKQEEEKQTVEKTPVEGRRVCPDCSNTTFNAVEDKSQVLHQMGGIKNLF